MIKNICIILATTVCLTSCTLKFSATTPTQKFDGSVTIYDIPVVDYKK
jgi:hypothetical protein